MKQLFAAAAVAAAMALGAGTLGAWAQAPAAGIDPIFARWSGATPGCAVGVSEAGKPAVLRAYGMADLEHDVPNTPETIFEAGSVSKQFTAAAVLLLARDGRLSLEDPVRKYFPELPEYGVPLTIRHMLNHTSGLRDWGSVASIAGWPRTSRVYTHKHVLEIISRQQALNFTPGTRYSYSNSGYNLAAMLVERVSGQSFAEFTSQRLFTPLQMTNTSWRNDHRRIVKGRAVAYAERNGTYETLMPFENVHGNGGLLTTVGDLLKWNANFESHVVGDAAFTRELENRGRYSDGTPHGYALGLMVGQRFGLPEVAHSGSTAGYRAHLTRYPAQRVSVAVLCNVSTGNATQYANQVAEVVLGDRATRPAAPRPAVTLTDQQADAAAGMFRDLSTGEVLRVSRAKTGLQLRGVEFVPATPTRFVSAGGDTWEVDAAGRARFVDDVYPAPEEYERVTPVRPTAAELAELAGTYTSDEAEVSLDVVVDNGVLMVKRRPDSVMTLSPLYKDAFTGALGTIIFRRSGDRVSALSVVQDRVWDLRFTRRAGQQSSAVGQAASLSSAFPRIDQVVRDFAQRENIPGAAWGVVVDGKLVHVGTTGSRELATRTPVTADTVFRIASMTKSFTAMAIVKLRDEGKLALDDPAERYVPELKGLAYPTSDSPRVTIRHLLSHAEGFPEDNPWGDQQLAATEEEFSAMMRRGIPFSNPPGVAYEYSNYGFAILGRIVQNVAKMPYRTYIAQHILKPLGMAATTLEPGSVPPERLAHGYRWEDQQWKEEPQLPDGAFGAMGGMLTSLNDLATYVGAYVAAWPPRSGPEDGPVSRASLREMQQVWRMAPASVTRTPAGTTQLNAGGYGYGLRVSQTCDFGHVVAHSGGLPGFGSQMRWLPEYGVALIAMGNRTYTGWNGVFTQALTLMQQTGALKPRMPEPSAALIKARDEVSQLVISWDDALADRVAAVNLFLDRAKERRRREIDELRAKVGACKPSDRFTFVENALRGTWTLSCERGDLDVAITLAPTMPPTVQYLEVTPSRPQSRAACTP
jgi:CubicO group peptidase (beta-lactamase class C family)